MEEAAEEAAGAAAHSWLRMRTLPLARARSYLPSTPSSLVPGFGRIKTGVARTWRAILEAHGAGLDASSGNGATSAGAGAAAGANNAAAAAGSNAAARPNHLDFPSFWHFFTSRYSIVLLILSLLVNRIHAVVPPSNAGVQRYRSSKRVRAIVRAPAILLLARACILILGMTVRLNIQEGGGGPGKHLGFVRMGGDNAVITGRDHSDIMWACFVAACMGVCSESFIRALDHDLAAVVPINLFTLGLLLHFHSMPYNDPICPPSRPVYFLLLLTLLEILTLHIAAVPGWRVRLWITATFTILSRSLMVYFWFSASDKGHTTLMPAIQSLGRILPEAFFVLCSTMTVALRALAQLITEGKINSTIFGHSSALPHRDDDFILALLKYGTAALETTALKGLNNEVSALSLPAQSYVELHPASATSLPALTAAGESQRSVAGGSGSVLTSHPSFPSITQSIPSSADAYSNEIRNIRALPAANIAEVDPMSRNPSLRKEIWRFTKALVLVWKVYVVGWLAETSGVRKLARRQGRIGRWLRWCGVQELREGQAVSQREGVAKDFKRLVEGKSASQSRAILADLADERAQEAEDAADADYEVVEPEGGDSASEGSSSSEDESADSDGEDEEEEQELLMPGDIRARSVTPAPLEELNSLLQEQQEAEEDESMASLLIAHMSASQRANTASPMTRRRFKALLQPTASVPASGSGELALTTAIATRRASVQARPAQAQWDDSTFRSSATCVVCCSEPRSIVFWPCRCLTTCEDCRQELAARSTGQGGSSICPCCRQEVQGYSRIHIP